MEKKLTLKRGLDLSLEGPVAPGAEPCKVAAARVAVTPDDFPGLTPRMLVRAGDAVSAGQPVAADKTYADICLVSPVSGQVEEVVRGERRKIIRIIIKVDSQAESPAPAATVDPLKAQPDVIRAAMLASGLWAEMRQRPYDIVPSPLAEPRDIFVTAFDSAPLAPDFTSEIEARQPDIAAGLAALKRLTPGSVYVSARPGAPLPAMPEGVVRVDVTGPHPAGNAGVQAANLAPVNKGDTVWTLDIFTAARLGRLLSRGERDFTTAVWVTGPEVTEPYIALTTQGAEVAPLIEGRIKADGVHHRVISGNVLTGYAVKPDEFMRFPYRQITVIAEGDDRAEFMGWASMSPSKLSVSRTFPLGFLRRRFAPDARILGGRRAMILSEVYDKVLPMDILPEYLFKAITARDIDQMERLGIYEIAPEDVALCEFVDPSKIELQKLVRQGLDYLRKELE